MANHYSALKRVRQTGRKTEANRMRKSRLRHKIRSLRHLMERKDVAGVEAALPSTYSIIDRAAKWGIIKPNTADRYKSRLAVRLKKLQAA